MERVLVRKRSLIEPGRLSPPIWPCTTRGFPCLRCCHRSGGLLPHLFTLAKRCVPCVGVSQVSLRDCHRAALRRRSILCGTFRDAVVAAGLPRHLQLRPLTLSGALPCQEFWHALARLPCLTTVSGLSSRSDLHRTQRSPGSPASLIIPRKGGGCVKMRASRVKPPCYCKG